MNVFPSQKPSAAARPSAAEKAGSEVSPDYDTTPAHFQKKAKRSGEGGLGVSTGYGDPKRMHAKEGQAQQPRRAQQKEVAFRRQQQPTRNKSKNKRRENCRLQGEETPALV
jgi:hypothetical protein